MQTKGEKISLEELKGRQFHVADFEIVPAAKSKYGHDFVVANIDVDGKEMNFSTSSKAIVQIIKDHNGDGPLIMTLEKVQGKNGFAYWKTK